MNLVILLSPLSANFADRALSNDSSVIDNQHPVTQLLGLMKRIRGENVSLMRRSLTFLDDPLADVLSR